MIAPVFLDRLVVEFESQPPVVGRPARIWLQRIQLLLFYPQGGVQVLILSRKRNAKVIIRVPASAVERTIEVVVVEIRGDKVRLGFEADKDIAIHRDEVDAAIRASTPTGASHE